MGLKNIYCMLNPMCGIYSCFTRKPYLNSQMFKYLCSTNKDYFVTGLRLTLYVGKDDYIGMFSPDVGARIAVHPADETPFPEDRGVSAAPGMITSIGTRLVSELICLLDDIAPVWLPKLVIRVQY